MDPPCIMPSQIVVVLPEWRALIDVECAHAVGACVMGGAHVQAQRVSQLQMLRIKLLDF